MNDATRAKLDQLQELLAKRSEIEMEIEALLGGAATPPRDGLVGKVFKDQNVGVTGYVSPKAQQVWPLREVGTQQANMRLPSSANICGH